MSIFNWFSGNSEEDNSNILVKTLKSKGTGKTPINITVGDIKRGVAVDTNGYQNEVVLFLRKNKKDR